jgi:hypothetical protein
VSRRIRVALPSDAVALSGRMRTEDLDEIAAYDPLMLTPQDVLEYGLLASKVCRTLVLGGVPEAIWGVVDCGDGRGRIWMLGAPRVAEDRRWFLAESARQVEQLETGFTEVYNFVDDRYEAALRWLRWLGFRWTGTGVSQWSGLPMSLMVRRVGDGSSDSVAASDCERRGDRWDGLRGAQQAEGAQGAGRPELG